MAALKVFVSSTCYDLGIVRAELREFLANLGHEPVMSEYNDILFDPKDHTHESCANEIRNADAIILIIGSRFGGKVTPSALDSLDWNTIKGASKEAGLLDEPNKISITQLEIMKAVELNIPIYTFVESKVMSDHHLYERNKDKAFINDIEFPSIDKKETALYIFKFINFLRLRHNNNSLFEFSKISDIQTILRKQWSAQLQRLLQEDRRRTMNQKQGDRFLESMQEIKSLILSTINTETGKEIGKGVLRFRSLISFCLAIKPQDLKKFIFQDITFQELLIRMGIVNSTELEVQSGRTEEILICNDNTFYHNRYYPLPIIKNRWDEFKTLKDEIKRGVFDSIAESDQTFMPALKHEQIPYEDYMKMIKEKQIGDKNGNGKMPKGMFTFNFNHEGSE